MKTENWLRIANCHWCWICILYRVTCIRLVCKTYPWSDASTIRQKLYLFFGNNPPSFFLWDLSVVRIATLASGQTCFGMAFPPSLMKQWYCSDLVITASFVGIGHTTRGEDDYWAGEAIVLCINTHNCGRKCQVRASLLYRNWPYITLLYIYEYELY
jgi:hypothetical protein